MASDRQIKANKENARLSTGPRTLEGKARSSLNAVRHGLLARDAVLPDEDPAAYRELLAALEEEYQPDGPTRTFLVQQLASAQWRLQRFIRIETGFFAVGIERAKASLNDEDAVQPEPDGAESPEDEYDRNTGHLGILVGQNGDGDVLAKLARYGSLLNREYYRALKALETSRRPTPPPQPIDEQRALVKTNPILPVPGPSPLAIKDDVEDHDRAPHESRTGPDLADPVFPLRNRSRAA